MHSIQESNNLGQVIISYIGSKEFNSGERPYWYTTKKVARFIRANAWFGYWESYRHSSQQDDRWAQDDLVKAGLILGRV